jgi:hypothetical protein
MFFGEGVSTPYTVSILALDDHQASQRERKGEHRNVSQLLELGKPLQQVTTNTNFHLYPVTSIPHTFI